MPWQRPICLSRLSIPRVAGTRRRNNDMSSTARPSTDAGGGNVALAWMHRGCSGRSDVDCRADRDAPAISKDPRRAARGWMMLLGVIADDFTGASDIGNTLAKGLPGQGGLRTA